MREGVHQDRWFLILMVYNQVQLTNKSKQGKFQPLVMRVNPVARKYIQG